MRTTMNEPASKTPVHLWIVGLLSLPWNGFGAYDYFMTKIKGDAYLTSSGMTPEQMSYFHNMPAWMTAIWAIGVWGALLGSILLLLCNKLAVPVFIASLVSFVLSLIYGYLIAPIPGGAPAGIKVMQAVILAGCVFFVWYASYVRRSGWLS